MALKFLSKILCFIVVLAPRISASEVSETSEVNSKGNQKRLIRQMLEKAINDDRVHDFSYNAKLVLNLQQNIFGTLSELLVGSEIEEEFRKLKTFSDQSKRINNLHALTERILADTEFIHKKAHELGFYNSSVKYEITAVNDKAQKNDRNNLSRGIANKNLKKQEKLKHNPNKKRLIITFYVDFGRRFKLKLNLKYIGKSAKFQERFRKKSNDDLATLTSSIADMKALISEAVRDLQKKGYYNPEVKEKRVWLDYSNETAVLNLTIDPGEKVNFGDVSVRAFKGIDSEFIRNRVSWEKGEEFNIEKLEETASLLNSSQIFSKVKIEPENSKKKKSEIPISITVKEDKKHIIDVSLLYSGMRSMNFEKKSNTRKSLKSVIARIFWTNYNTFGGAERLRVTIEGSPMKVRDKRSDYAFEVALTQPDVLIKNNSAEYIVSRRQELTNVFFKKDDKLSLIFSYPLWCFSEVRFGGILEDNYVDFATSLNENNDEKKNNENASDTNKVEDKADAKNNNSNAINDTKNSDKDIHKKYRDFTIPLELIIDRTDDSLNPTKGYKFLISYYYTKFQKAKLINQLQTLGTAFSYNIPLDKVKKSVLAFNVSYRVLIGKSIDCIPLDKRLYAGGIGSVRGYANQMATDAIQGKEMVMGGKSALEFNSEFRHKFTKDFGGVLFFDGAKIFQNRSKDEDKKIEKKRWFYSLGFGIRYFTAIGPIRADFAFPIRRRKKIDSRMQFILSLGQAF